MESAPGHDRDKALTPAALDWELRPLPAGSWPAEKRIPSVSTRAEMQQYNAACLASQSARRSEGKPFRDFESTVFVVPQKVFVLFSVTNVLVTMFRFMFYAPQLWGMSVLPRFLA